MKNLMAILALSLFTLVSCNQPSETSDIEPLPEEPQLSSEAHITFYNSADDITNVRIEVNSSEKKIDLSKATLSEYFLLNAGEQRIVITDADSGEELLTKTISLDGGQYYSTYFYKNHENEFDLLLNKDYDELERDQGSLTNGLDFIVVNLSSNIPFESLNIVNTHTYMTANCGANVEHCTIKIHDLKDQWVNKLAFGTSQKIAHAPLSVTTNQLQFISSLSESEEISVEGFTNEPRTLTIDPNGSGNLQTIERPNNLSVLDPGVIHLLILRDSEENEGVSGRFIELNTNPVSTVNFLD